MKKENWIDDVLNSGDEVNKVLPSHELLQRLESISSDKSFSGSSIKIIKHPWMAAAGIALLIAVNVFSMVKYKTNTKSAAANVETPGSFDSYFNHLQEPQL